MGDSVLIILILLFVGIPTALILKLLISISRYVYAKIKNKQVPDTFSAEEMKKRELNLILIVVIVCTVVAITCGLIALPHSPISFM